MSRQILLRSPTSVNKRQPLLNDDGSGSGSGSSRGGGSYRCKSMRSVGDGVGGGGSSFAEVAGGTTAECAAVCCCCPCGLFNLLVLAIYKVPAGLFRKAWRAKRRRQLIKKGLLPKRKRSKSKCGCDDLELQIRPVVVDLKTCGGDLTDHHHAMMTTTMMMDSEEESQKKVIELEKEMWQRFYSAGFWRSTSRREEEEEEEYR